MAVDKINKIKEDLEIVEPGNILAKLYRRILRDLGVTPGKFSMMVDRFVLDNNRLARRFKHIKPTHRSTLVNKYTADNMTWKVFLQAVFNVLRITKLEVKVTLHHANGKHTSHGIDIIKPPVSDTGELTGGEDE